MHGSRSCLGCSKKPPLVTAVDQPSKGLKVQRRTVKKLGASEDFWSLTSTCDMDNSTFQSQKSISSISNSNPSLDQHVCAGSTSNDTEFVNHGLMLWNQTRQRWIADKKFRSQPQVREVRLSWNVTYESLLGSSKAFARPIPLRVSHIWSVNGSIDEIIKQSLSGIADWLQEMVDFLVDVWEQEGLYD